MSYIRDVSYRRCDTRDSQGVLTRTLSGNVLGKIEARDAYQNLLGVASVYKENHIAHLSALMVGKRGIGIGSALTQIGIQWARDANASKIIAHTHQWNRASQNNLKRAGFTYTNMLSDRWRPANSVWEFTLTL